MPHRVIALGLTCAAMLAAMAAAMSGCVSSSTWRALEVERENIASSERERHPAHAEARPSASRALDTPSEARTDGSPARAYDSCDQMADAVLARSPRLAAPRDRARAALDRARADGALPSPRIRARVWGFPIGDPSMADRQGMYMLGVSQELMSSDLLDGLAAAGVATSRAALAELAEVEQAVRAEAGHACVDWVAASLRERALARWLDVLGRARDTLDARYEAGGGTLADLTRLAREDARTARMRGRAVAEGAHAAETLRVLLDLETTADLGPPPVLPTYTPTLDGEALTELATSRRGALGAAHARTDASAARVRAANAAASIPMFSLGVGYMQTPNAAPGLMLELGMSLPWLWGGADAAADAARAELDASHADIASVELEIEVQVRAALAAVETVASTLADLEAHEAPATRRALDAVEAEYAGGGGTLLDWLDSARAVRELSVEEVDLTAELAHRVVDLATAVSARVGDVATASDGAATDHEEETR